jgi:plastocyanin
MSAARAETGAGAIEGTVDVLKGGGKRSNRSGVYVYLEGARAEASEAETVTIQQKNMKFRPDVLMVPVGTTVEFPNGDKFAHNVFSDTRGARFDLGEYKSGSSKSHTFARAVEVKIYCNVHSTMSARLNVVDSGYIAKVRSNGSFEIPNVPPGDYTIVAWMPNADETREEITVRSGKASRVYLEVREGVAPSRHLRKDGTPYGRY